MIPKFDLNSVEQVKGISYELDSFLGVGQHSWDPNEYYNQIPFNKSNKLYHIVLYLGPVNCFVYYFFILGGLS